MRHLASGLLAATCLAAFAMPAAAADGQWTVGVSGGTLGVGPEIAYRYNERLGVRLNGGFLSVDRDEEIDDIRYNAQLKLNSVGLLADLYPFGGGFRISAGARLNNNEIPLEATPATNVTIGNTVYTPAQVGKLNGTVTTNSFAPTLTLGYGGQLAKGFTMGVELGVMLQGSPKMDDLRATGGLLASNPAFLADIEREKAEIEDDVDSFKLWPVLQLHLLYRF